MSAKSLLLQGITSGGTKELLRAHLGPTGGTTPPAADTSNLSYIKTEYFSKRKPVAKARQ